MNLSVKHLLAVFVGEHVSAQIALALPYQEHAERTRDTMRHGIRAACERTTGKRRLDLPVDRTLVSNDRRGDISLQSSVKPRLQNVDTVVESVQSNHRAARRRSRERPPGSSPVHTLAFRDVLRFLRIVHDSSDAAGKIHGHARSHRFLRTRHTSSYNFGPFDRNRNETASDPSRIVAFSSPSLVALSSCSERERARKRATG